MRTPEIWDIRASSNSPGRLALAAILLALGLALAVLGWQQRLLHGAREWAPLILGALLFVVGAAQFIIGGESVLTIDESAHALTRMTRSRFGTRQERIAFPDVESVRVSRIGNRLRNGFQTYFISLHLKNGRKLVTGWMSIDQHETASMAERLALAIGCENGDSSIPIERPNREAVGGAAVAAVLIYCLWFRFSVGPLCAAMWRGNAPIVVIALAFGLIMVAMIYGRAYFGGSGRRR